MDYRYPFLAALLAAVVLLGAPPVRAQSDDSAVGQFRIARVTNWQKTWLVGFETAPAPCLGDFKGHHAIAQSGGEAPSEVVLRLLMARNAGVHVDVAYSGSGPCDESRGLDGLLRIRGVR